MTLICTTDDPIDDLKWHKLIKEDDSFDVQVLPAWRPDKAVNINKPDYMEYIAKLEKASGMQIESFEDLKKALANRMDFFAENGCTVADHGLDYVMYVPASDDEIEAIFAKKKNGETLTNEEVTKFKTAIMLFLAKQNKSMIG